METDNMQPEINPIPPQNQANAVSLYGQADAMDDFPVLKAFQQYVDAEQAKAHKRLMTVCAFFAVLMSVVIGVFVYIIVGLSKHQTSPDPNAMAYAEMQRQMFDQQSRMNETLMTQMMNARASGPVAQTSPVDPQLQKENLELKAQLQAHEIERRIAERVASEAAARPTPSLSEDQQVAKEQQLSEQEARQKARDRKLAEREAKIAAEEKRLKDKEIDLQQHKLYPGEFSREARDKATADVKAAREESRKAQDEAKQAEVKALEAERRAQEAILKAEDAERAALLKEARLDKREREIAERERQMRETSAATPPSAPVPVTKPVEKTASAEKKDDRNSVEQLDGLIRFLDEECYDVPVE